MATTADEPPFKERPLNAAEWRTLVALITFGDPAAEWREPLLGQLDQTTVTGTCPCGCPSVDLSAEGEPVRLSDVLLPNEATVLDESGEPIGGIIVFTTDGYLSSLELYTYGARVLEFPSDDRLVIATRVPPE